MPLLLGSDQHQAPEVGESRQQEWSRRGWLPAPSAGRKATVQSEQEEAPLNGIGMFRPCQAELLSNVVPRLSGSMWDAAEAGP